MDTPAPRTADTITPVVRAVETAASNTSGVADRRPPTLREEQVALTRGKVVRAARRLFLSRGYVDTSIAAIATEANVAVQTIYNSVGNKVALLSAMLDDAASGPNSPMPVRDLMRERTDASQDVSGVLDVLADWFVEVGERTVDVWAVIQQAAAVDPEAADLARRRGEQRLSNYGLAAATLRERGGLTQVTDIEAAATIWSIGHPNVYLTLVRDLGWSAVNYRSWVHKSLSGALR
ncbi:TetR/AcrR family transcriptional regulator [Homoserinimonas sp. OAct 916]|uniref:TetR/AcrR family transcriptional regulator n=1 Tax=Homoserinimonas sp. OAct 916 TaxID=2211450 RepID=UPI000DBE12BB|nr:TetR/AcrR family transcriptional regulator [Homoserinimonas sp. OAct 916]